MPLGWEKIPQKSSDQTKQGSSDNNLPASRSQQSGFVQEKSPIDNIKLNNQTSTSGANTEDFESLFTVEKPSRSLEDFIGTLETLDRVRMALSRRSNQDIVYEKWGLKQIIPNYKRNVINLRGPSGVGKTLLAECIAYEMECSLIKAHYNDIEDSRVGIAEKKLVAAFEKSRKTNSMLFIDEADTFLSKRLSNPQHASDLHINAMRNVMLVELAKNDVFVIFATNLFTQYDDAFIRRIQADIKIDLPDYNARLKLWRLYLGTGLSLSEDVKLAKLAELSEGLSGGDLINVVDNAAHLVANREGLQGRVCLNDLANELLLIRNTKEENRGRVFKSRDVSDNELTDEDRRKIALIAEQNVN